MIVGRKTAVIVFVIRGYYRGCDGKLTCSWPGQNVLVPEKAVIVSGSERGRDRKTGFVIVFVISD